MDTLGYLLTLLVTPANEQERAQVAQLAEQIQQVTGESVQLAFVDQGYTGDEPAQAAAEHGIDLVVVKLPEAKRGFVLLPKRWVVERSFAGQHTSGVWPVIMSACPRLWRACILLPSLCSWPCVSFIYFLKVHNTF